MAFTVLFYRKFYFKALAGRPGYRRVRRVQLGNRSHRLQAHENPVQFHGYGANVRYGFNYPQASHDLIACSYFSSTPRAIGRGMV